MFGQLFLPKVANLRPHTIGQLILPNAGQMVAPYIWPVIHPMHGPPRGPYIWPVDSPQSWSDGSPICLVCCSPHNRTRVRSNCWPVVFPKQFLAMAPMNGQETRTVWPSVVTKCSSNQLANSRTYWIIPQYWSIPQCWANLVTKSFSPVFIQLLRITQ